MNTIELTVSGQDLAFSVDVEPDYDSGAPWENSDGNGPVSGWETRNKRPGELLLYKDGAFSRYYDFAEACRIALRDGWGIDPDRLAKWTERAGRAPTKRQIAASAARADYEYLRAWCSDDWHYVGVIVTLLNPDGTESDIQSSLWGIENSDSDYIRETARQLADEIAAGYLTQFELATVETKTFQALEHE